MLRTEGVTPDSQLAIGRRLFFACGAAGGKSDDEFVQFIFQCIGDRAVETTENHFRKVLGEPMRMGY